MIQGLAERIPKGQQIEEVLTLLLLGKMEATLMLTIRSQIHPLIQLWQRGYLSSVPFAIVIMSSCLNLLQGLEEALRGAEASVRSFKGSLC